MRSVRKTKLTLKNHRKTLGFLGVFLRKSRKSLKNLDFDDLGYNKICLLLKGEYNNENSKKRDTESKTSEYAYYSLRKAFEELILLIPIVR